MPMHSPLVPDFQELAATHLESAYNLARWLVRDPALTPMRVASERPAFEPGGEAPALDVQVRGSDYGAAAGAQIAVVSGDPFKEGLNVVRLKMPAGYKIPAHNHPTTEYVTVLSGAFNIGMGDKLDEQKGMALRPGGFAEAAAKMNHYAWASAETVVQVHGQGPFAITYVNPADDPSKK